MRVEPITRLHATAIDWHGCGALILGPSGSGKSSLALHLMALGCGLLADDQCEVFARDGHLYARCPDAIKGQIEARGFGILSAASVTETRLVCAVDLGVHEDQRLPEQRFENICALPLRLFHNSGTAALPFALLLYLKSQSAAPFAGANSQSEI